MDGKNRLQQLENSLHQKDGELMIERIQVQQKETCINTLQSSMEAMRKRISSEDVVKSKLLERTAALKMEIKKLRGENLKLNSTIAQFTSQNSSHMSNHPVTFIDEPTIDFLRSDRQRMQEQVALYQGTLDELKKMVEVKIFCRTLPWPDYRTGKLPGFSVKEAPPNKRGPSLLFGFIFRIRGGHLSFGAQFLF
jgi:chromosome segregation ATPase